MSFADRAKEHRQNGGAFRFPAGEYNTRLKGWEFKLSKKKNPMFVLEWKVLDKGDCKNKTMKDRFIISAQAEWQFDAFLVLLEDFGIDLNGLDDKDPQFQDIQDALDFIEGKAPTVKVELTPQEEDPRYYRIKYLEVPKVGEGSSTASAEDPADPEDPTDPEDDEDEELEEELPPPPAQTRKPATTTAKPAAVAGAPAKKKPWEK
jgi:hypothetical protein